MIQIAGFAPQEHYLPLHHTSNMLAQPSWRFIVSLVALKHGVMQREILGRGRTRGVVAARHEAMALVYRHTQASMPAVGRYFDRDHSSIHHALTKFGATHKLVERPTLPPPAPPIPQRTKASAQPRDARGKFRKPTMLQRAILRAYLNNVPASVVAEEYGCNPLSVKVIAHNMGLRRRDFKTRMAQA